MLINPSKDEIMVLSPKAVERKDDNSGTYVLDENGNDIAFIKNTYYADDIWLYYSSDVKEWLGL